MMFLCHLAVVITHVSAVRCLFWRTCVCSACRTYVHTYSLMQSARPRLRAHPDSVKERARVWLHCHASVSLVFGLTNPTPGHALQQQHSLSGLHGLTPRRSVVACGFGRLLCWL